MCLREREPLVVINSGVAKGYLGAGSPTPHGNMADKKRKRRYMGWRFFLIIFFVLATEFSNLYPPPPSSSSARDFWILHWLTSRVQSVWRQGHSLLSTAIPSSSSLFTSISPIKSKLSVYMVAMSFMIGVCEVDEGTRLMRGRWTGILGRGMMDAW